jgi:uncharacterized Tic20 family protein
MPDDNVPPPPPPSEPTPSAVPPPSEPSAAFVSPPYGSGKLSAGDDKTFCILAHILGIVASLFGPLIIWLIKKDESPAVDAHGKEALNFQITMAIALLVAVILSVVTCGVLFFLPFIPVVYNIVMCIIATMKASEGVLYRYPATLRLVK